jgi:hypothetical protein
MRGILGVASKLLPALLAASAGLAQAGCPPLRPQVLLERFISADCVACWKAVPPNPSPGRTSVSLDWIVPAPPGAAAPLAAAALMEAAPRAARDGRLDANEALTHSHPLPAKSALQVEVEDGPAWNGYIGLALNVRNSSTRPLPKNLSAWIALVERIDAGTEDTPVDRLLVRSVVGPLGLEPLAKGEPVEHLRAVRVPDTGKPERLTAVGWVESSNGRVIALGHSVTRDCPSR